jgi:hypothetical protein
MLNHRRHRFCSGLQKLSENPENHRDELTDLMGTTLREQGAGPRQDEIYPSSPLTLTTIC